MAKLAGLRSHHENFMHFKHITFLFSLYICLGLLPGCSSISNMFEAKEEQEVRLKGERIPIMALQTKLEPNKDGQDSAFVLPQAWRNEFWPQQGGYPNHAMHNPALGQSPLKQVWSSSIGRGSIKGLPLSSLPVVIDNKIYVLNTDSEVIAFSFDTGTRLWQADISKDEEDDTVIGGGIAGSRGKIFVTNGYNEVLKLDGETGDIEWRVPLQSAVRAAPTVLSGRVFIQTLNNQTIALAASDGDILWTHQAIGETSGLIGAPAPAVNRDIIVPGYSSGELFALRIENGGVAWQDNLSPQQRLGGIESLSDIQAMPVLDRGLVVAISFGGRFVAIDQRTGRRVWQRELGGAETPWVAGNSIFVLSSQNRLVSFDRETGNVRWVKDMPKFERDSDDEVPLILYGPVMAGGRLFVTASDGQVFEIDPMSGDDLNQWDSEDPLSGTAIVANETLFLLTENGELLAYQ